MMNADEIARGTCETCRFWNGVKHVNEEPYPVKGECRRCSPLVTGGMMSNIVTIWPETGLSDWCGEYQEQNND